jgi:hypothetical protein
MAAVQTTLPAAEAAALLTADDAEEVRGVTINDEPWAYDGGKFRPATREEAAEWEDEDAE